MMQTVVDPSGNVNTSSAIDGMKLKSTSGWLPNGTASGNGADVYGFRALPGGGVFRGSFLDVGVDGFWWSTSEYDAYDAWCRGMYYDYANEGRSFSGKSNGFSLRCTKD